jgi:hypothetical protein
MLNPYASLTILLLPQPEAAVSGLPPGLLRKAAS